MPSSSSVLLPLLQPAGQTRNVVSRAGAACKAADGAGEEPAFLFFLSFFIFFCFSLFSILSHLPGAAASPRRLHFSFYFFFLFFFFLFAFVFIFVFSFCFFIFAFIFVFSFCFFLFIFILIFYSCFFFVLSFFAFSFFLLLFLSLFFGFLFLFLLLFLSLFFFLVFIFASSFLFFVFLFVLLFLPSSLQSLSSLSNRSPAIHFFSSAANLSHSIQPLPGSSKKEKNIGKRIHRGEMASRKRTGGGRKGRGTEWSSERDGKRYVYYARKDKGEKEMGATGGGMVYRVELCREASPAAEGGRAGKKRREKGRKVCMFYMLIFSSFFCTSLQTQKVMVLLCISLCIHKKEKNVYVKLHTANKAGVMRAYVYVCILRKCSGWFRCTDFRKFCAGLFAYFFCWQPCGRQSLRAAGEVCMFICTKKKTKCICLHTQKKEQNVYVYVCKI